MNTQTYTVNIRTGVVNITRVDVSQGDTGRTLAFSLYDGLIPFTPPTGSTVTIVGRKPSGLGFSETCTVSGNTAAVNTTLAMTQEAGKFPVELRIESDTRSIGTANFVMYVEPSPHPAGTTDGTHATADNLQTQIGNLANLATTEKTNLVSAINEAAQSGSEVIIDDTLTQTGAAADSKKTGDEIASLKADLDDLDDRVTALEEGGVPIEVRQALLTLLQSAAYAETGLTDEIAVIESWAAIVTAIVLNQTSISISGASTDQLVATTTPAGGTVIWTSSDASVATVSSNGLVTGVGNGSCTITASCGGLAATCSVTVSGFASLTGITATYTQSGTVYNTDTLDSLKSDLVVTANYSDSTTRTLSDSDYTLSGTLSTGTSTITVTYSGLTTAFNVTVSTYSLYPLVNGSHTYSNGVVATVTNGNHVEVVIPQGSTGDGFIDFSDLSENSNNFTTSDNVKNHPSKFTILSGQNAIFTISNLIAPSNGSYNAFGTGNLNIGMAISNVKSGDHQTTKTFTNDTDVGCLFAALTYPGTYSFDVGFVVDGVRYV